MKNKINFFKINTLISDADFVKTINEIAKKDSICTLYTNMYEINKLNKNFSIVATQYAKYSKGIMFCWDILSVDLALQFPGPSTILFYMSELYWMENPNNHYKMWSKVFNSKKVNILVNNQDYQDILKLSWQTNSNLVKSSEDIYNAISEYDR